MKSVFNRRFTTGLLLALILPGCSSDSDRGLKQEELRRYHIAATPTPMGLAGRSVIEWPAGRCVVFHYPPYEMNPEESAAMDAFVASLLTGDPSTPDDDGEFYCDKPGRWCSESNGQIVESTFNCCTFAVGDVLGLSTDDWIMPLKCGQADDTFPMRVVLDSYFRPSRNYRVDAESFDWARIERDGELQQDDVLCFVQSVLANGVSAKIVHAGRIWKRDGRNWLVSKIGAGPILVTSIESLGRGYAGEFDVVQVHRLKPRNG